MFNPIKIIKKWNLDRKQKKIDKKYALNGFSNELLEEQIALNEERNKLNMKEKNYVQ